MKYEKINLQRLVQTGVFQNIRVGVEAIIEEGESPQDVLAESKTLIDNWIKDNYPNAGEVVTYSNNGELPVIAPEKDSKENATQRMINAMNGCTSPSNLLTFKLLVDKNPELKLAYDKKMEELNG